MSTPPQQEALSEEKAQMSDDPSRTPTRPHGTPVPPNQPKSWLPFIAGMISFLAIVGFFWWVSHRDEVPTQDEPVAEAADEDDDSATMTEAEEQDGEQEADPEPVAVSEPEPVVEATPQPDPTPAPAPVTPAATPAVASPSPTPAPAAAPDADPTGCTFANGNRPQVGNKYILTCAEGTFLATGEYKPGGIYIFSAFEPHTP